MSLTYNVYLHDFNSGEFRSYNVLNHGRLIPELKKLFKECGDDKAAFEEGLKSVCMYCFWGKCEYEIILSAWPPAERFKDEKVSAYDQLMLNWPVFVDYIWNHKTEIIKLANKYAKR